MLRAISVILLAVPLLGTTLSYTGGKQTFTASTEGIYDVTAYGGSGAGFMAASGGDGAEIGGDFLLSFDEVLDIYVGGEGSEGTGTAGGGGGGTFVVVDASDDALVVAGGGGGAGFDATGSNANTGTAGVNGGGSGSGQGGTAGSGGGGGSEGGAGGGGGFLSAGNNGSGIFFGVGGGGFPGLAGGAAGNGGLEDGGYGGGGGGSGLGGGGGGGYSGGGGAVGGGGAGGGGGSYWDPSVINLLTSSTGNVAANGYVVITLVQAVPEPASVSLLVLGLLSISAFARVLTKSLR